MNRLKDFVDPVAWAMIPCMLAAIAVLTPLVEDENSDLPLRASHAPAHVEPPRYTASRPLPMRLRS
jgi:hypothetical protein